MSSDRPDSHPLLTTALEKLLYLESRLEAAEAARADVQREGERHRQQAVQARRALADWQRRATQAEVNAEGAEREVLLLRRELSQLREKLNERATDEEISSQLEGAERQLERYAKERESWLDRMIAVSRLRADERDDLDLGAFIAELRAELLALRRGEERKQLTVHDRPPKPDPAALLATVSDPDFDPDAMVDNSRLSRAEKTLARLCAADLGSDSAQVRRRAVERLTEARLSVLNPWILQQIRTENDPGVRVAMVQLFSATGGEGMGPALAKALDDADPRVRAQAVEGLARRPAEDLRAALKDPSPAVRRRAIARLPRESSSLDHLADALQDPDLSVRHIAALSLSSRPGPEAEALLQAAARFEDPVTSSLAREALARRGLALHGQGTEQETEQNTLPDDGSPAETVIDALLLERMMDEIRTTLRGRTPEELAERLSAEIEDVERTADHLIALEQLVWRGKKLYLP
jgi:hypothetical protein